MMITTRYLYIRSTLKNFCDQLRQQPLPADLQDRVEHYLSYQMHDRQTYLAENLRYLQTALCHYLQGASQNENAKLVFACAQLITYCYPKNSCDSQMYLLSPVRLNRLGRQRLYYSSTGYWVPTDELLTFATVLAEPLSFAESEAMAMHLTTQRPRWIPAENVFLKWHVMVVIVAVMVQGAQPLCLPNTTPSSWLLSVCAWVEAAIGLRSDHCGCLLSQVVDVPRKLLTLYSLYTIGAFLGAPLIFHYLWSLKHSADGLTSELETTPRGMARILTPSLDQLPRSDIREFNQHLTDIKHSLQTAQSFRFSSGQGK